MNKLRRYRKLIIFLIVITTNLACWCVSGMASVIVTWAATTSYLLYVLVTAYRHRKKYYLAVFYADGAMYNAFIENRGGLDVRLLETSVKDMAHSKGNVVLVNYMRVSRRDYEASGYDNRKKD